MNLHICIDGVIEDSIPLMDGNDPFNAEAERTALDKAYEIKSADSDAVVTILIDLEEEDDADVSDADLLFAADAMSLLADLDEGEHTDEGRLLAVAKALRLKAGYSPQGDPEFGPTEAEFNKALATAADLRRAQASGEANEELTQAQLIDAEVIESDDSRMWLVVRYDVTHLSADQRLALEGEAVAQAEATDDGPYCHPSVFAKSSWTVRV